MNLTQSIIAACVAGGHIAALLLLIWALIGDRARGRTRCPNCWYDMSGWSGGDPCPECGHAIKSARHLTRTRRRRWLIACTILVELGCSYYWWQRTPGREGWRGLIPNAVLIELVDDPGRPGPLADTLGIRYQHGQLSPQQLRRVVERTVDLWIARGGPARMVKYRPEWPVGEPMVVTLDQAAYAGALEAWISYEIALRPDVASTVGFSSYPSAVHVNWGRSGPPAPRAELLVVREGMNAYDLVLQIKASGRDLGESPEWEFTRDVPVPVRVVGRGGYDDHIRPIADPKVDALLPTMLRFHVVRSSEHQEDSALWLSASMDADLNGVRLTQFDGVVVYDITIETQAGEVLATLPMRWAWQREQSRWADWPLLIPMSHTALEGLVDAQTLTFRPSGLLVRFKSVAHLGALEWSTMERRWEGDFVVPLSYFPIQSMWDSNRGEYVRRPDPSGTAP